MKKWMKWLLVTAGSMAAVGILVGSIGMMLGGNVVSALSIESSDASDRAGEASTYTVDSRNIRSIEVEWVSGRVLVEPHDGEDILLEERSANGIREQDRLEFEVDDDTLEIRYWEEHRFRFRFRDLEGKDLRILVPRELAENLDELDIENVSAEVALADLTARSLEVETVSGDVKGVGLTVGEVEMDSVSGDLSCAFMTCPDRLEVDTVSGDTELVLPRDSRFSVKLESVSGDLSSELPYTSGGQGGSFRMNSVSGDFTIRAAE